MKSADLYNKIHQFFWCLPIFRVSTPERFLPDNGVYVFYEGGELCNMVGRNRYRIVRVGTHIRPNRFKQRIKTHYHGSKNSSVFRKHVGAALLSSMRADQSDLLDWLKQGSRPNPEIERFVTRVFRRRFFFKCFSLSNRDSRLNVEERLISTLSQGREVCAPSSRWLGRHSPSNDIRSSGLWNEQHLHSSKRMESKELEFLSILIETEKERLSSLGVPDGFG